MFDSLRFWRAATGSENAEEDETEEQGPTYKEELAEMWEEVQELDDPVEKAELVEETVSGRQRTAFSEVFVNAVAADIAHSENDRNA